MLERNEFELFYVVDYLVVQSCDCLRPGSPAEIGLLVDDEHPAEELPIVLCLLLLGVGYLIREVLFI